MAKIVIITKEDSEESIQKKIRLLIEGSEFHPANGFNAKKFTGKVKSFDDGLSYQRKLRDEWN